MSTLLDPWLGPMRGHYEELSTVEAESLWKRLVELARFGMPSRAEDTSTVPSAVETVRTMAGGRLTGLVDLARSGGVVRVDFDTLLRFLDDLYLPGAVDLFVVDRARRWVLLCDHEEVVALYDLKAFEASNPTAG
ncbi:MAG: hypothetical protein H6724_12025 [Sandaracinus sp.]|nr:hypothetical protein [Sandaracinus sp.]